MPHLLLVVLIIIVVPNVAFRGPFRLPNNHAGHTSSLKMVRASALRRGGIARVESGVFKNVSEGGRDLRLHATGAQILPMLGSLPAEALSVNLVLVSLIKWRGTKSLTNAGLLHAFLLGVGLWSTLGFGGWSYGVVYFILGTLVTKVKMQEKKDLGIAEARDGARGPENVWGSAATSMLCALGIRFLSVDPSITNALYVAFAAALATKLSDTFGSEIGKAYGKTCYLITNFKLVPRGTEGAVSVEGTLAGVVASIIMAYASQYLALTQGRMDITAVVIAAFLATTAESYIGATFQDKVSWLTNELVNFINTLIGGAVAFAIVYFAT